MKLIYLAIPYSHSDPAIVEQRIERAERFIAEHLQVAIICTPVQNHRLALRYKLSTNAGHWCEFNQTILRVSSQLWVLQLEGWRESLGVYDECRFAADKGIPIVYFPDEDEN